ncbi:EamA family transporter [Gordonia sp. TBRC 11910]|uniref:EamA family transporter n=1 Tax=Gordonia asplenii TaxID=2725283 RepID=A0A848L1Z6_9ACTN|nr:EamA family transporter [Gordonia asplenii]NMO04816.1 EamA family transporter [Gordonia asplenii]
MIAIILASVFWGTTGTAATLLPTTVSPLATGAATMSIGGALLALSAPRESLKVFRGGRATWRWLVPGAVGVVAYPLAFYSSMSLAGVAIGNVVSLGTAPLFAALLEQLLDPRDRHRPTTPRWRLSAAVAIAGIALLAAFGHGESAGTHASNVPLGVGLGAVAGFAYALYSYTAARLIGEGWSSRGTVSAQFAIGGIALLPILMTTGGPLLDGGVADSTPLTDLFGTPPSLLVVAYLATVPMFAAYILFGRGLRTVPASRATTVTLLEPLVATLLAVGLVGERLTVFGWTGMLLVFGGVTAVVTEKHVTPASPHIRLNETSSPGSTHDSPVA